MATINLLPPSPNPDVSPVKNINKFPIGKTRKKVLSDVKTDNNRVKGRVTLHDMNKQHSQDSFRDEIDPARFCLL